MGNLCFSPLLVSYTLRDAHEKRIEGEREKLIAVEYNHSQNNNYNISSLAMMMMRRCWQRNYFQSLTPLTTIIQAKQQKYGIKIVFCVNIAQINSFKWWKMCIPYARKLKINEY